ncbi:hypothetical protein GCM10020367_63560 [Streptomyces sannanensis]|uniref:Cupin domain-containing protein n=1 Tax=Streptomyces sannanensis TaxID=285536 RepID=A0ABP6SLH6_9ACTN
MAADPYPNADGVFLDDLLRDAAEETTQGALWRLTGTGRQLDANLVRLPPAGSVADHVESDLDVLITGMAGHGTLRRDDTDHVLFPGTVHFLPRGTARGVQAGPQGVVYLTVHRRRPGLTIASASLSAEAEGGEPPCLLSRVCPACGALVEVRAAAHCARCGEQLPRA